MSDSFHSGGGLPYSAEINARVVGLQLDHLTDQMVALKEQLTAQAEERKVYILAEIKELKTEVAEMKTDVKAITRTADRWKGGFFVILSLGGLTGSLVTYFADHIKLWLR